jgi:excisionase family DNA binding protein
MRSPHPLTLAVANGSDAATHTSIGQRAHRRPRRRGLSAEVPVGSGPCRHPHYLGPIPAKPKKTRRTLLEAASTTCYRLDLGIYSLARGFGGGPLAVGGPDRGVPRVSKDTVYTWVTQKGMPGHRVGRFWKFKRHDVDTWVRNEGAASSSDDLLSGESTNG